MASLGRAVATITAVAGTLDLTSAFVFGGMAGRTPLQILRSVASGPFPAAAHGGAGWSAIGLVVHYAIMAAMVATYCLAVPRIAALRRRPALAGLLYGVGLYFVMYRIVLPLRFPALFPQTGTWAVGNALFSHCICVGLPIGLSAPRLLRSAAA